MEEESEATMTGWQIFGVFSVVTIVAFNLSKTVTRFILFIFYDNIEYFKVFFNVPLYALLLYIFDTLSGLGFIYIMGALGRL